MNDRQKRSDPRRGTPNRSARAAASSSEPGDKPISEDVSGVIQKAYDVIADNIATGRDAARRFRHGDYNIRDVPEDLGAMMRNMFDLARKLNESVFDVGDRLVNELSGSRTAKDRSSVGPFRAPAAAAPGADDAGTIKLTVTCEGRSVSPTGPQDAGSTTKELRRPKNPTKPEDISTDPLQALGKVRPLNSKPVVFYVDLTQRGLCAKVTIPSGRPAGWYSGLVHAKGEEEPLGLLTVWIKDKPKNNEVSG